MTLPEDAKQIILSKTKLFVEGGRLIRHSSANQAISDIPLKAITDVALRTEPDWMAIIFPIALFAGAWACKWFIPSPTLGWVLCISLAVVGLLSFLGLPRPMLTVRTREGKATFEIKEPFADAEAFALSLKQLVKEQSS
jgi:hypothetical protein